MVALRHTTQASGTNNADKQVSVDAWNENHSLTGAAGKYLGFDAIGVATELDGPYISPQQFGAVGDGIADDTIPLLLTFSALNDAGGGHLYFPKGTYLHGLSDIASIPSSSWKTSLLAIQATGNISLPLVGVRGAKITGHKGAVLKRKNAGCTIATTSDPLSWAQILLHDCADVEICGFTMNGNRAGQTHTSAMASGAANYHIEMFPAFISGAMVAVDRVHIHDMKFTGAGTLMTAADKQGDCIYVKNGVNDVQIDHNEFLDWGRWAVTLERGYPTAGGYTGTNGLDIHDNIFRVGFKEDGAVHIGAIDIEPWEPHHNVHINRNQFYGSCKVSFGSTPSPTLNQALYGHEILGNTWDMRGQIAATISTDVIIAISGDWGTIVPNVSVEKRRRFVGLKIEGNRYIADVEYNQFIQVASCIVESVSIRNNRSFVSAETLTSNGMIRLQSVSPRGDCYIQGNKADNKTILVDVDSFQSDFEDKIFRLAIEDNATMNCSGLIRYTGPTYMIAGAGTVATTATSATITGTGTTFRKQLRVGGKITVTSSGETLTIAAIASDTSATASAAAVNTAATGAFTRTPGVVSVDGNQAPSQTSATGTVITANNSPVKYGRRNSIGNVVTLTNVATPGRGSAIVLSGTTSIVVPHGLLGTPTNISVTPVTSLGSAAKFWVTAIGTTTFTINVDVNPAANVTFNWQAESANG